MRIEAAISVGELVDKVTILEIKADRIADARKSANVRHELADLYRVLLPLIDADPGLALLKSDLRAVNESLWRIEDDIRDCERKGDFGARFVELARGVYRSNDKRAAIKRAINERARSEIVEEKSYTGYD